MSVAEVYVGKDVEVTIQNPSGEEDETSKLIDLYNYRGVKQSDTGSHEAYDHAAASEPTPPFGAELSDGEYGKLAKSDNNRHNNSTLVNLEYAMILFRFKCGFLESKVQKIHATFEGYGTAPAGTGVTLKIWDHNGSAWVNPQTGTQGSDEEIVLTKTTSLINYIDASGYIYLLARTTNPSDGATAAVIYCDKMKCLVTKKEFTVEHTPISDLNMDGVADEPAHVEVKKNGAEVTVSSVNDSTGLVVLTSGDFAEGDRVTCEYRYDSSPYVAQEFTVEPKQEIEGLDGLGSDQVQVWAVKQKGFEGSIREVYREEGQVRRVRTFKKQFLDNFDSLDPKRWKTVSGSPSVSNGWLELGHNEEVELLLPSFRNGVLEWRHNIPNGYYLYVDFRRGSKWYTVRIDIWDFSIWKNPGSTLAWSWSPDSGGIQNVHKVKIVTNGEVFSVYFDDDFKGSFKDDHVTSSGAVHIRKSGDATVFKIDWIRIKSTLKEYGIITKWDDGQGNLVRMGFDGVEFPQGSLPSTKEEVAYLETPFRAKNGKVIT